MLIQDLTILWVFLSERARGVIGGFIGIALITGLVARGILGIDAKR